LANRITDDEQGQTGSGLPAPPEEVNDFIQKHLNHFPDLERAAEDLWRKAHLDRDELSGGLVRHLEKAHGVTVRIARWGEERGLVRRYDPDKRILSLSELLPTRTRAFQLAHQLALLAQQQRIQQLSEDSTLTTDESRALARVALANYFAGAVLMPYDPFLKAVREERYDIEVLGRRFRVGFEQVCHRLTTLRRRGEEGIPFHMIRIDVAGNISKRFSASGIRFARFSGACPRWNIFAAFATPGMLRLQISRMPDGETFFCLARTVQKDSSGYSAQQAIHALGLGCQIQHAREMVYSDGIDLGNLSSATPVGVTCRTCERVDCDQRAFPSLRHRLRVDENVRTNSLYSPLSTPG
jgi:predicted transcriptional regulator